MRTFLACAGLTALFPVASALGHIIAISGACGLGFDEQPFINLVQQLAAAERAVYANERPPGCTSFYTSPSGGSDVSKGDGYTI